MDHPQHPLVRRILDQLPPETYTSFSTHQLNALHQAARSIPKTQHGIEIRQSLPGPGRGFYLVLLAGREKRDRRRPGQKGTQAGLVARLAIVAISLMGSGIVFALSYGRQQLATGHLPTSHTARDVHPTVVPFKDSQAECERTHREWHQDHCLDRDHSHQF